MWVTLLMKLVVVHLAAAAAAAAASEADAVKDGEKRIIVPKCPSLIFGAEEQKANQYCDCNDDVGMMNIACNFNNTGDVLLNGELIPFSKRGPFVTKIQVRNAASINVTQEFLTWLMLWPGIKFEISGVRSLYLASTPEPEALPDKPGKILTFIGVSIIDCFVPELPKYFLRDKNRGALNIKNSRVGNVHAGILHKIEEMRYVVFEDSKIDVFEGSIATEGYVTLSNWKAVYAWKGLLISNTSIETISSGTFNLTHKSDMETVKVVDSTIGNLNIKALVLSGDMDVIIQKNVFQRMETEAIKVNVTGDVVFDKNDIANWEPDALEGMICHKSTSLEENIFRVNDPIDIADNISTTPFHSSCRNPQLFLVLKPLQPTIIKVNTTPAWILGALLLLIVLGLVMAAAYYHQRVNLTLHYCRDRRRLPLPGLKERKASQENLPNREEVDPSTEGIEEGVINPMYASLGANICI